MTFDSTITPPRDPFPTVPSKAFVALEQGEVASTPTEAPEVAENASQASQKINLTYLTQLEARAGVMEDRVQSFIKQLKLVGVVDPNNTTDPFVRGLLHDALRSVARIESEAAELQAIITKAREALSSL